MTTQRLLLAEPPDSSIPTAAPELRETFRVLDVVGSGWIVVLSFTTTAPPSTPQQGDAYLCPAGATGVWAGHQNHLAIYTPVGWIFRSPRYGWIAVVVDQNTPYGKVLEYTGTEWTSWVLPAVQVSTSTAGTDFVSTTLQALIVEINLRFLADEQTAANQQTELDDHESRITTLEAGSGGGGGGGGGVGAPSTIDDLIFWWQGDTMKQSSGRQVPFLQNRCADYLGLGTDKTGSGITRSATQLNSKNVGTWPASGNGRYNQSSGYLLKKATMFAVYKPSSLANPATFACGGANSLQFRVETTGKFGFNRCNVAGIGTSTSAMSVGTWYQINGSYDDSTGAYAFRIASAADASGTNVQTISAENFVIGYNQALNAEDLAGDLAELIIFGRVLTGTEISAVEAYLNTKWGV